MLILDINSYPNHIFVSQSLWPIKDTKVQKIPLLSAYREGKLQRSPGRSANFYD
jgi:hypothetical protein